MSKLTLLSDAELDAVSGGILNAGAGGAGGTVAVGATISVERGVVLVAKSNLSTDGNTSSSTGGAGGSVNIRVRFGGWY